MYRSLPTSNNLQVILAITTILTFLAITPVVTKDVFQFPECFNETRFEAYFKVCRERYFTEPVKPVKENVSFSVEACCSMKDYENCFEMVAASHCPHSEEVEKVTEWAFRKMRQFHGPKASEDCFQVSNFDCMGPAFFKFYFGFLISLFFLGVTLRVIGSCLLKGNEELAPLQPVELSMETIA